MPKNDAFQATFETLRAVSFHLIPVYGSPALLKDASPSLRKRMQGKSCFNFTEIDPAHVKELTAMTKQGFAGFVKKFP